MSDGREVFRAVDIPLNKELHFSGGGADSHHPFTTCESNGVFCSTTGAQETTTTASNIIMPLSFRQGTQEDDSEDHNGSGRNRPPRRIRTSLAGEEEENSFPFSPALDAVVTSTPVRMVKAAANATAANPTIRGAWDAVAAAVGNAVGMPVKCGYPAATSGVRSSASFHAWHPRLPIVAVAVKGNTLEFFDVVGGKKGRKIDLVINHPRMAEIHGLCWSPTSPADIAVLSGTHLLVFSLKKKDSFEDVEGQQIPVPVPKAALFPPVFGTPSASSHAKMMMNGAQFPGDDAQESVMMGEESEYLGYTLGVGRSKVVSLGGVGVRATANVPPFEDGSSSPRLPSLLIYSPTGRCLVAGLSSGVWVVDTAEFQGVMLKGVGGVTHLSFSPCGRLLVAAGSSPSFHVFETHSWISTRFSNTTGPLTAVAWNPNSSVFYAIAGSKDTEGNRPSSMLYTFTITQKLLGARPQLRPISMVSLAAVTMKKDFTTGEHMMAMQSSAGWCAEEAVGESSSMSSRMLGGVGCGLLVHSVELFGGPGYTTDTTTNSDRLFVAFQDSPYVVVLGDCGRVVLGVIEPPAVGWSSGSLTTPHTLALPPSPESSTQYPIHMALGRTSDPLSSNGAISDDTWVVSVLWSSGHLQFVFLG